MSPKAILKKPDGEALGQRRGKREEICGGKEEIEIGIM